MDVCGIPIKITSHHLTLPPPEPEPTINLKDKNKLACYFGGKLFFNGHKVFATLEILTYNYLWKYDDRILTECIQLIVVNETKRM